MNIINVLGFLLLYVGTVSSFSYYVTETDYNFFFKKYTNKEIMYKSAKLFMKITIVICFLIIFFGVIILLITYKN